MGSFALPPEIVDLIRFEYAPQPSISEEEAAIVTLAGRTAACVEDLAAELEFKSRHRARYLRAAWVSLERTMSELREAARWRNVSLAFLSSPRGMEAFLEAHGAPRPRRCGGGDAE